jgi:hypothetical protein
MIENTNGAKIQCKELEKQSFDLTSKKHHSYFSLNKKRTVISSD